LKYRPDGLEDSSHSWLSRKIDCLRAAHSGIANGYAFAVDDNLALRRSEGTPNETATVLVFQSTLGCKGVMKGTKVSSLSKLRRETLRTLEGMFEGRKLWGKLL